MATVPPPKNGDRFIFSYKLYRSGAHWHVHLNTKYLPEDDYEVAIVGQFPDGCAVVSILKDGVVQLLLSTPAGTFWRSCRPDHIWVKTFSAESLLSASLRTSPAVVLKVGS